MRYLSAGRICRLKERWVSGVKLEPGAPDKTLRRPSLRGVF
jgi:hypothetical protein